MIEEAQNCIEKIKFHIHRLTPYYEVKVDISNNCRGILGSALSEKIGLLDDSSNHILVQYYSELKYIEEEYKTLDIQGCSYSILIYLDMREFGASKISKPGWHEIEEFLRRTKKVYDLGKELIITLKE